MISTKWFQGIDKIDSIIKIRKEVFSDELNNENYLVQDIYDEFAFNVVAYEDEVAVSCGRLLFNDGKYFIDNVCVIKKYRRRHLGDLVVRMLVRKAINLGAEKIYAMVNEESRALFECIGFTIDSAYHHSDENEKLYLMVKTGDVCGHCGHCE